MKEWLRRLRGTIGIGLTWAAAGAVVGGFFEVFVDPTGAIVDIWPIVLAIPSFLSGAAFSVVLGIAGRRRRFDQLSLPQFAAWGVLGGALVGLIPAAMVGFGLTGVTDAGVVLRTTLMLTTSLGFLSGVLAASSLAIARRAEDGVLLAESEEVAEVGLSPEEVKQLLGGGT